MKVMFSDKLRIFIDRDGGVGTLVRCRSNETYKDDWGVAYHLKNQGRQQSLPQQSLRMCILKSWIVFSFYRYKMCLVEINSFFKMIMHLVTRQRGLKRFFRKGI